MAEGEDIAAAIAARCEAANIGLAALLVHGAVTVVDYQVMCHIPLNGVRAGDKPVAQKRREGATSWNAIGIYAANPTVRSVVSHGVAAVHLHGRLADPLRGGHVNSATVGEGSSVRVFPLRDLVVRISDLDVAVHDNRP